MKFKCLFFSVGLCYAMITSTESFIIEQPKKTSSKNNKTKCCDALTDSLKLSPQLLKQIAELQDAGLDMITAMLEDSFFVIASKEDLQKAAQEYEQFKNRQEEIELLLQEQLDFLQAQQKKYTKTNNSVTVVARK
ncbi:MAG TPA: hypothetical protein VFF04_05020 [Candidatus Babeliales bacterium]|nr:hypothetical protein [Candidatus Babeliales bacterium]